MKKNVCPCCGRKVYYETIQCFGCGTVLAWFTKSYYKENIENDYRLPQSNLDMYERKIPVRVPSSGADHMWQYWGIDKIFVTIFAVFISFDLLRRIPINLWILGIIITVTYLFWQVCRRVLPGMYDEANFTFLIYPYSKYLITQDKTLGVWVKPVLCSVVQRTLFFGLILYLFYNLQVIF